VTEARPRVLAVRGQGSLKPTGCGPPQPNQPPGRGRFPRRRTARLDQRRCVSLAVRTRGRSTPDVPSVALKCSHRSAYAGRGAQAPAATTPLPPADCTGIAMTAHSALLRCSIGKGKQEASGLPRRGLLWSRALYTAPIFKPSASRSPACRQSWLSPSQPS